MKLRKLLFVSVLLVVVLGLSSFTVTAQEEVCNVTSGGADLSGAFSITFTSPFGGDSITFSANLAGDTATVQVESSGGSFAINCSPAVLLEAAENAVEETVIADGSTSAAVSLNVAPPRPTNPDSALESLPGYLIVNTDNLNVRSGDGPQYTVVAIVDGGTNLIALGRNQKSTWWYVLADDILGWVWNDRVLGRGDLRHVPVVPSNGEIIRPTFFVWADDYPLYDALSVNGQVICSPTGGMEYYVIGQSRIREPNWYEIEADCGTGWIGKDNGALRNPAGVLIPVTNVP